MASAAFPVNAATRKLPYDPHKSFAWVGTLGFGPSLLAVGSALKVTMMLVEMEKWAKVAKLANIRSQ